MKTSNDVQAVIFKEDEVGLSFLVLERFDKEKNENHFRLVKGGIEDNEDAKNAIDREIAEETGIDKIISKKNLPHYSYVGGKVKHEIDVFLVKVNPLSDIVVNSDQEGGFTIHRAIWMTGKEAIEKLTFKDEKELISIALKEIG